MRSPTLSALLPLTLLGCTIHTYSTPTLPQSGFAMQAAPGRQIAQGGGGEVGAGAQRDAQPRSAQPQTWRNPASPPVARADRKAAPNAVHAASEGAKDDQPRPSSSDGAQAIAKSGDLGRASTTAGAHDARPAREQDKRPTDVARDSREVAETQAEASKAPRSGSPTPKKKVRTARPDGGVVMLARGTSAASDEARAARWRERKARGFGPRPREPQQPSSHAARVLKSTRDDDRATSRSGSGSDADASATAKLEGSGMAKLERTAGDASSTAQLAHAAREDERESLATK